MCESRIDSPLLLPLLAQIVAWLADPSDLDAVDQRQPRIVDRRANAPDPHQADAQRSFAHTAACLNLLSLFISSSTISLSRGKSTAATSSAKGITGPPANPARSIAACSADEE